MSEAQILDRDAVIADERERLEYITNLALTVFLPPRDPNNPMESTKSRVKRALQLAEDHVDEVDHAINQRMEIFESRMGNE